MRVWVGVTAISLGAVRTYLRKTEVLALTACIWFLAKFLRYAFPPLFEPLQGAYGVSNAVLGAAFTAFMLFYAAMQFPSGILADKFGSVAVITLGVLVTAIAALTLVFELPFLAIVAAMALMGLGTGAHKTVAVRLLSRAYPSHTGRALGIQDTVGTFGGVAAPIAVVLFVGVSGWLIAGWRLLFFTVAIGGFLLAVAFVLRVPKGLPDEDDTETSRTDDNGGFKQYLVLFREWKFSVFVLMTVLFAFTYNAVIAFLPLYLTSEAGTTTATANLLYGALFAASFVQVLTGEASDRIGTGLILVVTTGIATVALAALIVFSASENVWLLGTAVICIGIGAHGYRPVRDAYLMSVVPVSIAGGSLGAVRTLLMGAGAISPAVVGILSETVGFQPAFWLLVASVVGATACAIVLWIAER
jgi:MFS family permease